MKTAIYFGIALAISVGSVRAQVKVFTDHAESFFDSVHLMKDGPDTTLSCPSDTKLTIKQSDSASTVIVKCEAGSSGVLFDMKQMPAHQ